MVRNCVKTRRMDVALLSLSKMKEARMAREVRNAIETEPESQTHVCSDNVVFDKRINVKF